MMIVRPVAELGGRRILVVEDDYLIAADLARSLEDLGASVAGPAGTVADAMALVAAETALDMAVLDVNLGAAKVFPVADALIAGGVPFVFVTGYDDWILPAAYDAIQRFEKPVDAEALARGLVALERQAGDD